MSTTAPEAYTRERAAIHEAGHAVMAYLLGVRFTEISVVPDEESGTLGYVVQHPFPESFRPYIEVDTPARRIIEQRAKVCLAGAATEAVWCQRQPGAPPDVEEKLIKPGAAHDYQVAIDMANYVVRQSVPTLEAYIEYLRQEVLDVVGRGRSHDPAKYMSPVPGAVRRRIQDGNERFWALVEALAGAVLEAGKLTWPQARKVLHEAEPVGRWISEFPSRGHEPSG